MMSFPKGFVWGAAAASYQVEGAAREDGKGLSVWDMMCRWSGKVADGNTGDVSCDHYHRYREDAVLMGELGLHAYRLSISWPRVIPTGTGKVNAKGVAFYDRLVDALLANNVKPWVTLFHWDYPYELFLRGGWLNPDSSDWFADYARVVVDRLSDRVTDWMTLNEPQCFIGLGHRTGEHAPGLKLDDAEVMLAWHNSLLAHGKAVQVIRAHARRKPRIGCAPTGMVAIPASKSHRDVAAAKRAMFVDVGKGLWSHSWWSDPMVLGRYPAKGIEAAGAAMPPIGPRDMKTISQPIDFLGVNIYSGDTYKAGREGTPQKVTPFDGPPLTTMEWHVTPEALYWGPKFLHERYGLPIVITENGLGSCDWPDSYGAVHDPQRIDFTRKYLLAYRRAIEDGVPALGYFHWSIMDNFEWAFGYKRRFGLVHVDFKSGRRTPKDSAAWYRNVIASNGATL